MAHGPRNRFGGALRAARTAKKLSLREFAELADISPTYLSMVERGKAVKPPTAERARKMAELLGENADKWIGMAGRMPEDLPDIICSQPEALSALLRSAKGMSADQIRRLIKMAERMKKGR